MPTECSHLVIFKLIRNTKISQSFQKKPCQEVSEEKSRRKESFPLITPARGRTAPLFSVLTFMVLGKVLLEKVVA